MVDLREWFNMSGALQAVFQNQRSFAAPPGQQAYTTAGTYSWVAPAGVTKVSAVTVGAGGASAYGGGTGGGLGYKNNYTVSPGCSYTVVVGAGAPADLVTPGTNVAGGDSYFISGATVKGEGGGAPQLGAPAASYVGDGGGNGGTSTSGTKAGSGAGGYSGNGGNGGGGYSSGCAGTGGAGGGGGMSYATVCCFGTASFMTGAGGGVGILGQGSSGSGGFGSFGAASAGGGGGGSGGSSGGTTGRTSPPGAGGSYGGGAGQLQFNCGGSCHSGAAGGGAVRIIWPGCARSFPSTRTADE